MLGEGQAGEAGSAAPVGLPCVSLGASVSAGTLPLSRHVCACHSVAEPGAWGGRSFHPPPETGPLGWVWALSQWIQV